MFASLPRHSTTVPKREAALEGVGIAEENAAGAKGCESGRQELREIALKKKLVNFWNSQRVYWDGISTEEAAASPQRERAVSFLPVGAKVLDVACGSAANASLITRRCSYIGSDISETGLRRANTPALRLVCGDVDQLPFAD